MTASGGHTLARALLGAALLAAASAPAAAAIPPEVEAMIREAARSGDKATLDAVVRVARATNLGEADAIGALANSLLAEQQAKARREQMERITTHSFLDGWKGQGQAGFGLTSGNTNETSLVLGVNLDRPGQRVRHKFSAFVDYLHSNGVTARQKYAASYAINFVMREGLYAVGTLGWERDRFAGYSRRFSESFGLGYRALGNRRMTLDLEAGPVLRQTRDSMGLEYDEFGGRASLAYRWTMKDGLSFTQDASVVSDGDNTTLISTTALTSKITGKLSGRLSFYVQKETDPPEGLEKTDTATRATLVYDF